MKRLVFVLVIVASYVAWMLSLQKPDQKVPEQSDKPTEDDVGIDTSVAISDVYKTNNPEIRRSPIAMQLQLVADETSSAVVIVTLILASDDASWHFTEQWPEIAGGLAGRIRNRHALPSEHKLLAANAIWHIDGKTICWPGFQWPDANLANLGGGTMAMQIKNIWESEVSVDSLGLLAAAREAACEIGGVTFTLKRQAQMAIEAGASKIGNR